MRAQEKTDVQLKQWDRKTGSEFLFCLLLGSRPSKDCRIPMHPAEGSLLSSPVKNANLIGKYPHGHAQEIKFKLGIIYGSSNWNKKYIIAESYASGLKIWKRMISPLLRNSDQVKPGYLKLENLYLRRVWEQRNQWKNLKSQESSLRNAKLKSFGKKNFEVLWKFAI